MTKGKSLRLLYFLVAFAVLVSVCLAAHSAPPKDIGTAFASDPHDHADGSWTAFTESADHTLGAGKYYLTENVKLTGPVEVNGEVTLCLNGFLLEGSGTSYVVDVSDGAVFTLFDCNSATEHKFYKTAETGAAVFYKDETEIPADAETYTVTGGVIGGGNNEFTGGGVYVYSAVFNMEGGNIAGNFAQDGGGVYLGGSSSEFNMTGGSVRYNEAFRGGGIANGINTGGGYGTIDISGGTVSDNTAMEGGGIALGSTSEYAQKVGGKLILRGASEISRNKATDQGGGVWLAGEAEFEIDGGSVSYNEAPYGGGVYAASRSTGKSGKVNFVSGDISYNTATVSGGGVGLKGGILAMTGGSIVNNEAVKEGGGVYSEYGQEITVTGGDIGNNEAGENGGGICAHMGGLTLDGGEITDNRAGIYGGGIYSSARTEIKNGSVSANFAVSGGGGIYKCADTDFRMSGGSVTLNTVGAESIGSAVYCSEMDGFYTDEFILTGGEIKAADANKDKAITLCDYGLTVSGGYLDGGIYATGDGSSTISVTGGYYSEESYIYGPRGGYLVVNTDAGLDADFREGYPYAVYRDGKLDLDKIYNINVVYDGEPIEIGTELELSVPVDSPVAFEHKKREETEYSAGLPSDAGYFDIKVTATADFVIAETSAKAYYEQGDSAELGISFYIAQASPERPELPASVTMFSGDTLSSITLPEGWAWSEPDESYNIPGDYSVSVEFVPEDTENYYTVTQYITVTVSPRDDGGETPDPEAPGGETPDPEEPGGETDPEAPGGETPDPEEPGGETDPNEPGGETPGAGSGNESVSGGSSTETPDGSGAETDGGQDQVAIGDAEGDLTGGEIAGIVVGSAVGAAAIGFGIFWFAVKKKSFADLLAALKLKK